QRLVFRREDLGGEVDREGGVDRPVVPLDGVAHAGGDEGADRQPVRRLCAVEARRRTLGLAGVQFLMAGHGTPGDATRRGESRVGHGLAGLTRSKGRTRVVPSILILDDAFLEPYPRYSIWFSDEHRSPYQQIVHPLPRWHPPLTSDEVKNYHRDTPEWTI